MSHAPFLVSSSHSSDSLGHPHADAAGAFEVQPGRIWFAVDADHTRRACREAPATYMPGEAAPPTAWPGFPDAGVVHATLRSLQAIGNDARLRFIDALRVLYECNLYYELGYASYEQYCDRELGLARSTAFEYLQVARALDGLPRLRILYGEGELSWAQVRAISRVATETTEAQWIEMACADPVKALLAEAVDAQRTGRDAPREKRYGLPCTIARLVFEVTLEEKERVRAAFDLVGLRLADEGVLDLGKDADERAAPAPARSPLVRWADGILSGAIPLAPAPGDRPGDAAEAGTPRPTPAQTIVYRTCPECRTSTLATVDGPVDIPPARVDDLAPVSNRITIDADEELPAEHLPQGEWDDPNSARLSRLVLHRDGMRCANPGCGRRRNLHAHHIVFRSKGGRTVLANEVTVCDVCHSLLHQGLLEVTGSVDSGLQWRPRPRGQGIQPRDADALRERLRCLDADLAWSDAEQSAAADSAGAPAPACAGRALDADESVPARPGDVLLQSAAADSIAAPTLARPADRTNGLHRSATADKTTHALQSAAEDSPAAHPPGPPWSAVRARPAQPSGAATRMSDLAQALVDLGYSRAESERRLQAAIESILAVRPTGPGRPSAAELLADEGEVLRRAIQA